MTQVQVKMKLSFPQEKKFKGDVYGLKERNTCRYVTIIGNEIDLSGFVCRNNGKMNLCMSSLRKIKECCPVLSKEESQVNAMPQDF